MKTITVPGAADTFNLRISQGRALARFEVEVYNTRGDYVAMVVVYHDGDAEIVDRPVGDYRDRSAGWRADLCNAVAEAVQR